jgi:hypothetical protein
MIYVDEDNAWHNFTTADDLTIFAGQDITSLTITTCGYINLDDFDVSVPAIPTVTSISPSSGQTAGGTTVVITGTNFNGTTGASSVKFGSTNATSYTVDSATQFTATSPAGSEGTVHITVTNGGATSATSSADQFTYDSTPPTPTYNPANGATGVAINVTPTLTFGEALYISAGLAMAAAPTGEIKVYEGTSNLGTALNEGTDFTVAYDSTGHKLTVNFGANL